MNKTQRRQRKTDRKRRRQENGKAMSIRHKEWLRMMSKIGGPYQDENEEESEFTCFECGSSMEVEFEDESSVPLPICMICGGAGFNS